MLTQSIEARFSGSNSNRRANALKKWSTLPVLAFLTVLPLTTINVAAQESREPSQPATQEEQQPAASSQAVAPRAAIRIALKDKYHAIEVGEFDVAEGVEFPAKFVQPLHDEVVKEFGNWDKLKQVLVPGQNPTEPMESVLRLTGTVISYDKGSRGERYLGFGGGAGQIVVYVTFQDASTGENVVTAQIIATMTGGLFGGGEKSITREFAKTCVTTTKLLMEKPVPSERELASHQAVGPSPAAPDRQVVTILGENIDKGQADLNAQAAAGYRLVALTPRGVPSADVAMEHSGVYPQVYQYRLIHVHQPGNLQKDLNEAALQGFHYCPRSLAWLSGGFGGFFVAVVEKPPVPSTTKYKYRVHSPMQVSNAQKDIANDQRENFNLIGTIERPNLHVVLLEQITNETGE